MNDSIAQSWWVPALRGVIAVLFGALALMWPGLSLLAFVTLFAAYALAGGVVSVIGAFRNRKTDDEWWLLLILGLVGIGAGIVAIVHPAMTALVLILVIAANALISGVLDIASAIRLRKSINGEWMLILNGIVSIVFGVVAFLMPAAGALALAWMISFYAVLTGILLLSTAFRLRTASRGEFKERRIRPDRRHVSAIPAHS
ncbi:HdeD family acid-resistance protein [Herbaspirillum sp. HC18]|nr:HdeD family acid-resistance protein [Herbaspirillum sp. HC18]